MNRPTIERVHEIMKANDMIVFSKPFDVTLFAIRTKDNRSNKFNDWLGMSFFTKNGGIQSVICEGTTDAGLYYRMNPMHIDGTAIIQHGVQHRGAFTYMKRNGHRNQEGFRQTGKIGYWRDNDRNEQLDFVGVVEHAIYNTNGHDMGTAGNNVGTWSAGCWGAVNDNMDLLYSMAHTQIEHGNGDKFSLAMLHEDMF